MSTDHPFVPAFSRQAFFESPCALDTLRRLDEGLGAREPFLLVTGEPGTGKSTIANEAIARWGERVTAAYLTHAVASATELLEEILRRFGAEAPEGAGRLRLVGRLETVVGEIAARGRIAMVVVDDAHHLTPELLEELRLIVNAALHAHHPLEVLLLGPPSLDTTLDHPALAALRQRIAVRARLEPLTLGETRRYLQHRLDAAGDDRSNLFPRKTCAEIAALSRGIPRQINALAGGAMRRAREAGRPTVEQVHVREAAAALAGLSTVVIEAPADAAPVVTPAPRPATPAAGKATPATVATPTPVRAEPPTVRQAAPVVAPQTPAPAPPPVARIEPAPTPAVPAARAPVELEDHDTPAMPVAPTDPKEWVARFVGDRGPVRIGCQVTPGPSWSSETFEPQEAIIREAGGVTARLGGIRPRPRGRRSSRARIATTASLATLLVVPAVFLGLRATRNAARVPHGDQTAGYAAATPATPAPRTTASRVTPLGTPPVVTPPTSEPAPATEADAAAVAPPHGPYTLDPGLALDMQTALEQRDRLQSLTGIQGWVVPNADPTAGTYRVVLGVFRSYTKATAAADMLVRSRTLDNVQVVALPPRRARQ